MIRRAFALICFCDIIFLTNRNLNQIATKTCQDRVWKQHWGTWFDVRRCIFAMLGMFGFAVFHFYPPVCQAADHMGWRPLHRACFAGLAEVAGGHWQLTSKVLDLHGGIPKAMKDHPKREGPMVFRVQNCQKLAKHQVFLFISGAHEFMKWMSLA